MEPTLVLDDPEFGGFGRGHEIEHPRRAHGPDDGTCAARVLNERFRLSWLRLAGMVEHFTRGVGTLSYTAQSLLEQEVHMFVGVFVDGMKRDQRVEHKDIDL